MVVGYVRSHSTGTPSHFSTVELSNSDNEGSDYVNSDEGLFAYGAPEIDLPSSP